jgi:hypothetical protein
VRGRAARQRQNRAYYQQRHGRQGSIPTPAIQKALRLPNRLTELALLELPDSTLFREALASADNLDESEMPQWDQDPPYLPPEYPTNTIDEEAYTKKMVDVMNGRRLRLERIAIMEREGRCKTTEDLRKALEEDLQAAFDAWKRLDRRMETYDGDGDPRAFAMASNLLQWRARNVHTLYNALALE